MTDEPISYLSERRIRKLEAMFMDRHARFITTLRKLMWAEQGAKRLREVLEQITLCRSVEEASQLAADALATDLRQRTSNLPRDFA